MTNPKHRYKKRPGYNVEMIHDFLKHLEWELRNRYFEYTQPAGLVNEELIDMLAKYQKKRNCIGLLAMYDVDTEEMANEEEAEAGLGRWRAVMAQRAEESLEALESLQDVFEEALYFASKTGKAVMFSRKLVDIIRELDESTEVDETE